MNLRGERCMGRYRKLNTPLVPIDDKSVAPPPWHLFENDKLDKVYYNFMMELQKTDWEIEITKKESVLWEKNDN